MYQMHFYVNGVLVFEHETCYRGIPKGRPNEICMATCGVKLACNILCSRLQKWAHFEASRVPKEARVLRDLAFIWEYYGIMVVGIFS
jgi:hypothetical protein